jgi:Zn-finger in Ran binding protein and others
MARSEEALIKRAAKRLVPLEEQKVKDSRRKKRTAAPIENTESKRAKVTPVKAVKEVKAVQISEKDDWICGKCSNKNFHHRETCNRCQGSREIKKDVTPKLTDVISPKPLALKLVSETSSSTATKLKHSAKAEPGTSSSIPSKAKDSTTTTSPIDSDSNWTCLSCKNENFAARSVCNRCQSSRPSSLGDNVKKESTVPKMVIKNPAAKNSAGLKCWGKQASDSEIAANMALRKVKIDIY